VATPIGNLGDITLRALKVLGEANTVYCEDTRLTRRLMERYALTTRLHAYHDHNAEKVRPAILARLGAGETIALVSDAGTPLISDPGYKLVRAATDAGIAVTTEPGASAVLSALVLSGLPADRFLFLGFLPPKQSARRTALGEIKAVRASLVLFEAPQRLPATLSDLVAILGNRRGAIARELTKLHETVRRGSLAALAEEFAMSPRGEIVIIVGPPEETAAPEGDLDALLGEALGRETLKTAVAEIAAHLGLPRAQVYARALALSGRKGRGDS
jgi:16S rRNA (cytidine1402-2'-O)-methyltransferase